MILFFAKCSKALSCCVSTSALVALGRHARQAGCIQFGGKSEIGDQRRAARAAPTLTPPLDRQPRKNMHIDMQDPPTQPPLTQPASCPPFSLFIHRTLQTPTKKHKQDDKVCILAASLRGTTVTHTQSGPLKRGRRVWGGEGEQKNQPVLKAFNSIQPNLIKVIEGGEGGKELIVESI